MPVWCLYSLPPCSPSVRWRHSTRDPGQQPFSFRVGVGEVIRGWDEGCLSMQKHELSRLTICGLKAYGAQGFPAWGIPPNADLQFEIQILAINGM